MNDHQPQLTFAEAAILPAPGDNVAIATRRLDAGITIEGGASALPLPHTVLEGHRFVVQPIAAGADLLSWGLPFGTATRDITPGEYVCNERILEALVGRREKMCVVDKHRNSQLHGQREESLGLVCIQGQRLLHQHGLSCRDRGPGNFEMGCGWSSDS